MGHRIKSTFYILYICIFSKYIKYIFFQKEVCVREDHGPVNPLTSHRSFCETQKNMIPWVLLKTHEHSSVLTAGGAFGGLSYDTIPTFKEFTVPVAQLTHETLMCGFGCGFQQWLSNIAGSVLP